MNIRRKVWLHRSRAIVWAIIGVLSFPLGWANSVVLVWIASLYANISTDYGNGEAADDRAVTERLDRMLAVQEQMQAQQEHMQHQLDALLEQRVLARPMATNHTK